MIVPLMQADAVDTYHWMGHAQFLNAVALGQVTPGPVTHTVAAVGYAAGGFAGALLAAFVAFAPSFAFVLLGAARFERLLLNERAAAFDDMAVLHHHDPIRDRERFRLVVGDVDRRQPDLLLDAVAFRWPTE